MNNILFLLLNNLYIYKVILLIYKILHAIITIITLIIKTKFMKKFTILIFVILVSILTANSQSITVSFPNGGEHWINNTWSPQNIVWESDGGVVSFLIEYSKDNGSSWNTIESSYSGVNNYSWTTPDIISSNCLIRISDADNIATNDQSDAEFLISDQSIYYAQWNTSMGVFRVKLRGDLVPTTVQNFINLSEKEFYTDLIFHRVIEGFMIQDGCPLGTGTGDPGYSFNDEFHPDLRHNQAGILSMANSGANTNGSQYFITLEATDWLDDVHAIFGKVIDGMDIVYAIGDVATDANDRPIVPVEISSIEIVEENKQVTLTYPSDGESIINNNTINNIINIEWESDFIEDVKIEFSSDNQGTWETLTDSIPAWKESFEWTMPSELYDECFIKITSLQNPEIFTVNSSAFEIRLKPLQLTRFEFYENVTPAISNPNNLIMPDAVVKFKIKIKNDYSENLNDISATISCDNEDVDIINETITFDPISSGEEMWSSNEFEVYLPEGIPNPADYQFTIVAKDDNIIDQDWVSFIEIPIIERNGFSSYNDDESGDSQGNGDKILEPNETIEMNFKVKNYSSLTLYEVSGKLTSLDNFIEVWDNIEGEDGTVYNTTIYNNGSPVNNHSLIVSPENEFVFNYNANGIYETNMLLEFNFYLNQEAGASWDEGGILLKCGVPWLLNEGYTNINENNNSEIVISPNPTKDYFNINFNNNIQKEISIFSVDGKLLQKENTNSTIHKVNCSKFESGIYIIKINSNNQQTVRKVILK